MPSLRSSSALLRLLAFLAGGFLARRLAVGGTAGEQVAAGDPATADPETLPRLRYRMPVPLGVATGTAAALMVLAIYGGWTAYQSKAEARAVAIALTRGDPDRAPLLVTRYGCGGCHTIPGAPGADGKVAAPLSDMRQRVYVAGVLRNTPGNLVAWIVNPPAFSPRTAMPVTGISEAEARDVAALLYMD